MSDPVISAPAGFVPQAAVSFSQAGVALAVDADHPLPIGERPYQGAAAMAVGVEQVPGRAIAVTCTSGGSATFRLADDSVLTIPIEIGFTVLPFAVKAVLTSGTTVAATFAKLV